MTADILWAVLIPGALLGSVYLTTRAALMYSRERRAAAEVFGAEFQEQLKDLEKQILMVRQWIDGKRAHEAFTGRKRA